MIGYWFFKSFLGLFQIRQLCQWLMKLPEWKYVENKFHFFPNFADVLIVLVTILFHILMEFPNCSIFDVRKPRDFVAQNTLHTLPNLQFLGVVPMTWDMTWACTYGSFVRDKKYPWRKVLLFWYLRLLKKIIRYYKRKA